MAQAISLVTGNRAVGLLREVEDLIASEDSSLELRRIAMTLRGLSQVARTRSAEVEAETHQIAEAARKQSTRRSQSFSARVSALTARC